jgi:hypothetical protein
MVLLVLLPLLLCAVIQACLARGLAKCCCAREGTCTVHRVASKDGLQERTGGDT